MYGALYATHVSLPITLHAACYTTLLHYDAICCIFSLSSISVLLLSCWYNFSGSQWAKNKSFRSHIMRGLLYRNQEWDKAKRTVNFWSVHSSAKGPIPDLLPVCIHGKHTQTQRENAKAIQEGPGLAWEANLCRATVPTTVPRWLDALDVKRRVK